jgi:3-oxoacyl-[acyl-carrier protein] reductase
MSIKKGRVALITGAGLGLGKGTAKRFAEAGASMVLADINEANVKGVCEDIQAAGYPAIYVVGDISKKEDCERIAKAAVDKFGTIDILFNCAGIHMDAMFHKMTEEVWDKVVDVDMKGTFLMTQAVYPYMREAKYGRIINVASNSAYGNIGQANYTAAKAGIIGLSNVMALEFARYGITSNVILPGTIETEALHTIPEDILNRLVNAIPLKRIGEPDDIANMVMFFAAEESGYITGQQISVDGGMQTGVHV